LTFSSCVLLIFVLLDWGGLSKSWHLPSCERNGTEPN